MMKTFEKAFVSVSFIVVCHIGLGFTNSASAGIILPAPAPAVSGTGLGFANVAAIITGSPNNDNVPAAGVPDNNIVVPLKRFDQLGYIDIEFTVDRSNGVTEYLVSEFVDNNTGVSWSGYNMQLGFGTGAAFTQAGGLGDGLDFDTGPPGGNDTPPTSGAFFSTARPDEDNLQYINGIHGSGAQPYSFRIDVSNLSIPVEFTGTFTMRQIPVAVPEPAALVLAGFALVGLACSRRR